MPIHLECTVSLSRIGQPRANSCHAVFDPIVVFHTLYRAPLLQALQSTYGDPNCVETMCHCVETRLVALYGDLRKGLHTSSQLFRLSREPFKEYWTDIQSNVTCLCCMFRHPEHPFPCRHSVCDNCVYTFGDGMLGFEYQFALRNCTVCEREAALIVKSKPPPAGLRILSIDGGGIGGRVPLEMLALLQDLAGPNYPVQDFFDLIIGTSVGGLIALSLARTRHNVRELVEIFTSLTKAILGRSRKGNLSPVEYVRKMIKCWLSDGFHDVSVLEQALKEHFGGSAKMFDHQAFTPSGTKVAVTTTTVTDASALVFANYNGEGKRGKDWGMFCSRHSTTTLKIDTNVTRLSSDQAEGCEA